MNLKEPLIISPFGGGNECYFNIVGDHLGQGYHQYIFASKFYPTDEKQFIYTSILRLGCKQLPDDTLSKKNPENNKIRKTILSAFKRLDNAMPQKSIGIQLKAPGKDAMPLVRKTVTQPDGYPIFTFFR